MKPLTQLQRLASKSGGSKTDALRRSVAVASHIDDAMSKGGVVQIKRLDGTIEQIIFI